MISPEDVSVQELPVLPAVIVRLMDLEPDADGFFDEVLSLAGHDPTFAVRVIHALNAAYAAPTQPIESLRGAIARLGASHIRDLVTAMSVAEVFVPRTDHEVDLWVHAVEVATAARLIARDGRSSVDEHQAHLCGLLHDMGRFVMFDRTPEKLRVVNEHDWADTEALLDAEQREFGYHHTEIGHALCVRWGLPVHLGHVVRDHHRPIASLVPGRGDDDLVAVVATANRLSRLARFGVLQTVVADEAACRDLLAARGLDAGVPAAPMRAVALVHVVEPMLAAGRAARTHLALPREHTRSA